ncbi:hypothetical protein ABG79_00254 [Caloramator mitchellensis]|uniref:Uncharacterized protein n=1 Tax=Caloramator mitchellensis TaxID=908809 RepID=A0A0R3JX17_CALMK|nr:DUF5057 domain-containing protein [Caloramator mitchellensis]KRQ88087.1 hypothetical protein ABG79_00254 [Caloramator mitchellensis]
MKNNLKLSILTIVLITFLSTFLIQIKPVYANYPAIYDTIRILEIVPDYKDTKILNNFISSNKTLFPNITVDAITLNQLNSMRNDINGEYDLIYFSKGKYGLVNGDDYSNPTGMNTSDKPKRYNDITNLRAKKIKDMINSGQCVLFDVTAFNDNSSKLYLNLYSYVNNNMKVNISSFNYNTFISYVYNKYISSKKRLQLEYFSFPDSNVEYRANDKLVFAFRVKNTNGDSSKYKAKLYIDYNRDSLFNENELSLEQSYFEYNILTSIEYLIPYVFTASIDWKLDLIALDTNGYETKIKYTTKGMIKYKGKPIAMNVLQLQPGNTFSLNDAFKKNSSSLGLSMDNINTPKTFKIANGDITLNIDTLTLDTFNNNVFGNSNLSYEKYRNLDANYDMIIFGFKDAFDKDVSVGAPLNAIMDFQQKGLGIMLTHDTFWYKGVGKAVNLKKNFIGLAGQAYDDGNRYKDTIGNDFRYLSEIGKYIKYTLMRADSGILKETNTNDIYATKINTNTMAVNKIVKANNGLINQYPYVLNDSINVGTTHMQYYGIDLEDENVIPWFNLDYSQYNKDITDSFNYYYTYSTANITYSGTGHTPNAANSNDAWHKYSTENSPEELKLFINTMVKSFLAANHKPEIDVITPAENEIISTKSDKITVSFIPYDFDLSDGKNIKAIIYIEDSNGNYLQKSSKEGLMSGEIVTIKDVENIYYKTNFNNVNKKMKIVLYDSKGASVEKVINLTVVDDFVEPEPILDYKIFQNTNYPIIEGITGDSKDNAQHKIYVSIKDDYGNIIAASDKNEIKQKGGERFQFTSDVKISDTVDFNKPYTVEVYQRHDNSEHRVSRTVSGKLYIDTIIPTLKNFGATINGNFVSLNDESNSLIGNINSISGIIEDADPEVKGSITLQKKNENNDFISINSQPIKNGAFSVSANLDLGLGEYRILIEAKDRAGNILSKIYYLNTLADLVESVSLKSLSNKLNTVYSNNNYISLELLVKNTAVDNLNNITIPLVFKDTQKSKFAVAQVTGASFTSNPNGIYIKINSLRKNEPVKVNIKLKITSTSKNIEIISVELINSNKLRYEYQGKEIEQKIPANIKIDFKVRKFKLI